MHMMSGSTPSCSAAHIVPGATDARLHLVERRAGCRARRTAGGGRPASRRRDDVAALALDRLDEDRRDVVGSVSRVNSTCSMYVGAGRRGVVVRVGERGVEAAGREDAEPGALAGLAGGQRQAAQRSAVEGAEEGDHVRAPGVVAGELERRLDGLGAGVGEEDLAIVHRGQRGEALAHVGVGRQVEVARAVVQDVVDLGVDGGVDGRVGVTGGDDGDAGVEVEEAVAVDVLDDAAPARRTTSGYTRVSDGLVTASSRAMISRASGPGSSVRRSGASSVGGEVGHVRR